MKHFAETECSSKYVYVNIYSKANSANATKFLRELIENVPYKVRSIQVDGGSEFMDLYTIQIFLKKSTLLRYTCMEKVLYNGYVCPITYTIFTR